MKPFCFSSALLTLLAIQASGALLLSDRFNYADGPITEVPGTQWSSHGGTVRQVNVSNGAVQLSQTESEDVNASLSGVPVTNTTIYASFSVQFSTPPRGDGGFFLHFKDAGTGQRAKVYASTNGTPKGFFHVGIGNSTGAPEFIEEGLALGVSHRLVVRYRNTSPGVCTLWVAPASEATVGRRAEASDSGNVIQVHALALRQSLSSGDGMGILELDDLLVGTEFQDVAGSNTPPTISAIPDLDLGMGESTAILPFIVEDQETLAEDLKVTLSSSVPELISPKGASFHGAGRNRGLRIVASPGRQGIAVLTLIVSDGTKTSSSSFTVTVGAPRIDGPVSVDIPMGGESGPLSYRVGDRESAAAALLVSAESSNTNLLRADGIRWTGAGEIRVLQLTPLPGITGLGQVLIRVTDSVLTREWVLQVNVFPALGVLVADGFDRPEGLLVTGDGSWNLHAPTDGNVSNVVIRSGHLLLSGSQGEDVSSNLKSGPFKPESAAIFYAGLRFRVTTLPSSQGSFFGHFRDDRSGFRGRLHLANKGNSQTHFQLGVAAGLESPVFLPGDLAKGEFYTVVLQYRVGNGEARLWFNPNSESDSYLRAETEASPITISNWAFREADGIGGIEVDWIRVATSFDQALDSVQIPTLRAKRAADRLRMEWNRELRVRLQGAWSLPAAEWFEVGVEPQDEGNTTFVEFPLTEPSAFFRLRLR